MDGTQDRADPLDDREPNGWRRYEPPRLAWEPRDEMEDRSTVGRGWQYARWNRPPPYERYDRRTDPSKTAYGFGIREPSPAGRASRPAEPR